MPLIILSMSALTSLSHILHCITYLFSERRILLRFNIYDTGAKKYDLKDGLRIVMA